MEQYLKLKPLIPLFQLFTMLQNSWNKHILVPETYIYIFPCNLFTFFLNKCTNIKDNINYHSINICRSIHEFLWCVQMTPSLSKIFKRFVCNFEVINLFKHLGVSDFPIIISGIRWFPLALKQNRAATRSLNYFRPQTFFSVCEARVHNANVRQ